MRVKATREQIGELAPIRVKRQTMQKIGRVIVGGVLENIQAQRTYDEKPLKSNARSTMQRKADAGQPTLSLVDKGHRLVKGRGGSYTIDAGDNVVTVKPSTTIQPARKGKPASPAQLAGWVQDKGYLGWFGISTKVLAAIAQLLRNEIALVVKSTRKTTKR